MASFAVWPAWWGYNVVQTMPFLLSIFLGMVYIYIPPINMVMTGGWCKWHCFNPHYMANKDGNRWYGHIGLRMGILTMVV
jgi:hypothetical protein